MEISREVIRKLKQGESLVCVCADSYDFFSKRSTAYTVAQLEGRKISCTKGDNWTLTITRLR